MVQDRIDKNHPTVSFHDGMHDAQTEARPKAERLGSKERLEDPRASGIAHSSAGVVDGESDIIGSPPGLMGSQNARIAA